MLLTRYLSKRFLSTFKYIKRTDFDKQVWVNGKGVTYEIDRKEETKKDDDPNSLDWQWRISQADLNSPGGPFSKIAGVDRILILLEGDGISLDVNGAGHQQLLLHEPRLFPADVETDCIVTSETGKDLNIMYNRETCNAFVSVITGSKSSVQIPCGTETAFAIALSNAVSIEFDKGGTGNLIETHNLMNTEALKFMNPSQKDTISVGESNEGSPSTACIVCFVPSPKYS